MKHTSGFGQESLCSKGQGGGKGVSSLTMRSVSLSRHRHKAVFFYGEERTRLARTGCGEVGWRDSAMGDGSEGVPLGPAYSLEGLSAGSGEEHLNLGPWGKERG